MKDLVLCVWLAIGIFILVMLVVSTLGPCHFVFDGKEHTFKLGGKS